VESVSTKITKWLKWKAIIKIRKKIHESKIICIKSGNPYSKSRVVESGDPNPILA